MIKAFTIRKPGDELSERLSDELIASGKNFNIRIEKIDGVYSNQAEIIQQKGLHVFEKMKEAKKQNRGMQGCFLSHYQLWEKCLELNEPILIFEHDALIIRPLPENFLDLFTHHAILDYACHYPDYEEIVLRDGPLKITNYPFIENVPATYKGMNSSHVKGSHAHAIKPAGARKLIDNVKRYGFVASDMCVNQFYTSYITIDPIIARVNPYVSQKNRHLSHTKS